MSEDPKPVQVPILEAVDVGDQVEAEGYIVIGRYSPGSQWITVTSGDIRLSADEALRDVAEYWEGYEFRVLRVRVPMPVNIVGQKSP